MPPKKTTTNINLNDKTPRINVVRQSDSFASIAENRPCTSRQAQGEEPMDTTPAPNPNTTPNSKLPKAPISVAIPVPMVAEPVQQVVPPAVMGNPNQPLVATLVPYSHVKDKFHGKKDDDFEQWLDGFQPILDRIDLTDGQKLAMFRSGLAGAAHKDFMGFREDEKDTLEKAIACMKNLFAPVRDTSYWMTQLQAAKQQAGQSVRRFAHHIKTLVFKSQSGATPAAVTRIELKEFQRGLKPDLARLLAPGIANTLQEAVTILEQYEHDSPSKRPRHFEALQALSTAEDEEEAEDGEEAEPAAKNAKTSDNTERLENDVRYLKKQIKTLVQASKAQGNQQKPSHQTHTPTFRPNNGQKKKPFDGICYNCQQKGHVAARCRNETVPRNQPQQDGQVNKQNQPKQQSQRSQPKQQKQQNASASQNQPTTSSAQQPSQQDQ